MAKDEEELGTRQSRSGNRPTSPTSSRRSAHHDDDVDKGHRRSKHYKSKRSQSPSRSRSSERKQHDSKSHERSSKHRSKRHRHSDRRYEYTSSSSPEQDRKRSKREKHHKHKRSSKTSDKKKKTKSKHDEVRKHRSKSSFNENDLVPIGPRVVEPPSKTLDPVQDYFSYHNHLRLFLFRRDGTYFEDLTSSETHRAFEEFCALYNSGKLESAYYPNFELPQEALDQCKRTRHAWNFKTTQNEIKSLNFIKSGVKQQTEYDVSNSKKEIQNPRTMTDSTPSISDGDVVKKDQLLRSMGITPGQKIKIVPRSS